MSVYGAGQRAEKQKKGVEAHQNLTDGNAFHFEKFFFK